MRLIHIHRLGVAALLICLTGCITYDPGPPVAEAQELAENFIKTRQEVADVTGRVIDLKPVDSFSRAGQPYIFPNSLSFRKVGWTYHVEGERGMADVTINYESVDRGLWKLVDWGILFSRENPDAPRDDRR